ncbi:sugar phosphate isomerase/epimerase [Puniceicoccaceae bacterium K14]|nr:sugar phosphate isomerase/epimerase [Puniceicoccaceae bacterium K14]
MFVSEKQGFARSPITVFTKPWQSLSPAELVDQVYEMGVDGVELPVREGFQVDPVKISEDLPSVAKLFEKRGLKIYSVATVLSSEAIRACGDAGVPILRTMLPLRPGMPYLENVEQFRETCREFSSVAESCGVSIGLQNHCDSFACSALSIIHAIEPLSDVAVSAVLDLGHTGLEGEREDIAIDIAWSRLSMVNLKNALRFSDGKDERGEVIWNRTWVPGKEGYTSWRKAVCELARRKFAKPICLTAEYKDNSQKVLKGDDVLPVIKEDIAYLKELMAEYYK